MIEKALIELQQADKEFIENKKVGQVSIEINYFLGGCTNIVVQKKESFKNKKDKEGIKNSSLKT